MSLKKQNKAWFIEISYYDRNILGDTQAGPSGEDFGRKDTTTVLQFLISKAQIKPNLFRT